MRVHIEWPTLTIHIYPMLTGLPPRVHARVMDYDEACIMHLTRGVVHNFPKAVGVYDFCPPCTYLYSKRERGNPRNSGLSSQQ